MSPGALGRELRRCAATAAGGSTGCGQPSAAGSAPWRRWNFAFLRGSAWASAVLVQNRREAGEQSFRSLWREAWGREHRSL